MIGSDSDGTYCKQEDKRIALNIKTGKQQSFVLRLRSELEEISCTDISTI